MVYPDPQETLAKASEAKSMDELKEQLKNLAVDTAVDNVILYTGLPPEAAAEMKQLAKALLDGAPIDDTLRAAVLQSDWLKAKVAELIFQEAGKLLPPDDVAAIADMVDDPKKAADAAKQALFQKANEAMYGKAGDAKALAESLWGQASKDFVEANPGPVTVLMGQPLEKIFWAVELPALMAGDPARLVSGIPAGQLGPDRDAAMEQVKDKSSPPKSSSSSSSGGSGRPAARLADPTTHGTPLTPGTGSLDVLIGSKPAWRGLPAAGAAALQSAQATSDSAIKTAENTTKVAQAAAVAQAGSPTGPAAATAATAAYTAEQAAKTAAATALSSMMAGLVASASASIAPSTGTPDTHICPMPSPVPPHGPGYVIDGSQTVLVNGLPLCRQADTVMEALGGPDKIVMGEPTVLVGG